MKQCRKCLLTKEEVEFTKDKKNKDGLSWQCKECRTTYFNLHKEKMNNYHSQYQKENKDKIKEIQKRYLLKKKVNKK